MAAAIATPPASPNMLIFDAPAVVTAARMEDDPVEWVDPVITPDTPVEADPVICAVSVSGTALDVVVDLVDK